MKALLHTRLINLRVGDYVFSAGIFTTVLTIALLYVMINMAQWQAGKAEYKDNLREKIVARKDLPPVEMDQLSLDRDDRLFMPVKLRGVFDSEHNFLLDNRVFNGQVGYDVYSPLSMSEGVYMLVNRGFVPQGKTRQDLPKIETPAGVVTLEGLLNDPPSRAVVLADGLHANVTWPMVLQYVDVKEIENILGNKVSDMVLWLNADDPHSFMTQVPALHLDSAKNTGYAFQWYALSAALIIIYFFVNIKRSPKDER